MSESVPVESPIYQHVQGIPFLDTKKIVSEHLQTCSFDLKHLCKRAWHPFLKERVTIKGIPISKKNLFELLQCENKEHLVYPKEKQNVPSAGLH